MNVIETRGLTKYYGKARGIVDLDLTVREGDSFGFIGPNGAGKSTTIRTLLGLIQASSGSASVLGRDFVRDRQAILREVGYLPSETMFYAGMRVRDVLKLSADLRHADCGAEARQLCERLQLDPGLRMESLSLGNRKKVGVVCALQHRTRLYILDEPTSGLDPLMQREFFAILEERHRDGATVFLSSHVLSEIQRYCSRAAIIREGRLAACGDVAELSKTNAKRVTLHGKAELSGLPGVRDWKETPDGQSFLYSGDLRLLLKTLADAPLTDVSMAEPELEEVFLHYYTEGGEPA